MSIRWNADENEAESVRQFVRKEAKKVIALLSDWPLSDETIHDARKRLKKVRAGLRLAREALGERTFRRENRAFRDAARPLSEIRDAKILIEAFDKLLASLPSAERGALQPLRDGLMAHRMRVRGSTLDAKDSLAPLVDEVRSGRRGVRRLRGRRTGWSALERGLRKVYRGGRDAMFEARERPTVERLHEWRKQAKYLWHHLQMLEPIHPRQLEKLAIQAHRLSDRLGDDHDLAVLRQRLLRTDRRRHADAVRKMTRRIDRRRKELQAEAMKLGARVYEEKPRVFAKTMRAYRRVWRSEGGKLPPGKAARATAA